MKKRTSAYLFASALLGTFFGIELDLAFEIFLALCLIFLFMVALNKNHLWRIACFLAFVVFIFASATRFARSSYDIKLSKIIFQELIYEGQIQEITLRLDGTKKLRVNIFAPKLTIMLTLLDSAAALDLKAGHHILFKARLIPMQRPLSAVYFDAYRYGLAHNIHARASIANMRDIFSDNKHQSFSLSHLRQTLRQKILKACTPHQGALLLALILGETSLFTSDQKNIYEELGAQHLLAVSGLQVTLIAALVFFLLLPLFALALSPAFTHRSHIFAALITLIFLWFFVGLCQWPKSAVRAGLMSTIMLMPLLFSRKPDLFDALCASGFLCLLFDPLAALDLGFLLSYAAVLGLLLTEQASTSVRQKAAKLSLLLSGFLSLALSSIAAFLATLPIIAYFFGFFSPLSSIANIALVPIASILQVPAILLASIGALFNMPPIISFAAWCASLIEHIAEHLSKFLGFILFWPEHSSLFLLFFCLGIFLLFLALLKLSKTYLFTGLFLCAFYPIKFITKTPAELLVRLLPVGQGDASLFSFSNKSHMLIDAGGQAFGNFDPGSLIILPTLKRLGIKTLDILVISHPDPDHILGAFALLENLNIKEIWHSGYRPDHVLLNKFLKRAQEKNIIIKNTYELQNKIHRIGASSVEILAPQTSPEFSYDPALSANNNSLVLKITHDQTSLLWPGDLEAIGEERLLSSSKNLSATILKAPHHGSKTSSSPEFIKQVKPSLVLYSTGFANKFNFPHQEVCARYESAGAQSYNTAVDGEITLRLANNKLAVDTFVKKRP